VKRFASQTPRESGERAPLSNWRDAGVRQKQKEFTVQFDDYKSMHFSAVPLSFNFLLL
jgi:hypothetical protein